MRITSNIFATTAHRLFQGTDKSMGKNLEKVSSGLRINRAADDPAGLPISEKMRNQVSGLKQAMRNAQDGISLVQTAEGALIETHAILNRMRDLAVQAGNGALQDDDRAKLNQEFAALQAEINRIAVTTEFNTKKLLDGNLADGISLQVDANTGFRREIIIVIPAATGVALGIDSCNIANHEAAISAIGALDAAISNISTIRSGFGSVQNRLEHAINNLGVVAENLASSQSRIRDADLGDEMTSFSKNQILSQSAIAMMAQANTKPQSVLKIVG
jgi:flagellin